MNRENIKIVRDHLLTLREEPLRFNMSYWTGIIGKSISGANEAVTSRVVEDCGTCACIAGWAEALIRPRDTSVHFSDMVTSGGEIFDLSYEDARKLFIPWETRSGLHHSWISHYEDIPPQGGARVLTHLLETGEVDWSVIGPRVCYNENGEEVKGEP